MEKLINVTIDRMGNPVISTQGFQGSECLAATSGIEKALTEGAGGANREFMPEYYQNSGQVVEQHLRRM